MRTRLKLFWIRTVGKKFRCSLRYHFSQQMASL